MIALPNLLRAILPTPQVKLGAPAHRVAANTWFELVPLKNLDAQLPSLPPGSRVSVTCSPAKGIDATLDLTERLVGLGLQPTPHIAARLVRDRAHVRAIAARCRTLGIDEAFVMAGDEEDPIGAYDGAAAFLRHFATAAHGLERIGVAGYPDGHLFIYRDALHDALHEKQQILASAGVDGWVSTQMCFDSGAIRSWLTGERTSGLTLPVRLGVPGPVDRAKLITMGLKVGVGQSLRYLSKNRSGLQRLMTTTSYDPGCLLESLGRDLKPLGVEGVHLFTFNQIAGCVAWHEGLSA